MEINKCNFSSLDNYYNFKQNLLEAISKLNKALSYCHGLNIEDTRARIRVNKALEEIDFDFED